MPTPIKKRSTPSATRTRRSSRGVKKAIHRKVVHHARKLLVPHKSNQYRPHLIRMSGLAVVVLLAIGILGGYNVVTTGTFQVLGYASNISVTELVADTNQARQEQGLEPLAINSALNRAAYAKAQDMLQADYWAHVSPSGVTPWKWLADQQYDYNSAGENLAKNYPTAQATVDAWMASPTHRDNILKAQYKEVGFAVVDGILGGKNTTLVVAYYGEPVDSAAPIVPTTFVSQVNGASTSTPLAYVGSIVQSLSPAALGVLLLLAFVGGVAAVTHHYRKKLPRAWQRSWRLHHGLYTVFGVLILMAVVILGTGGGQL